VNEFSWRRQLRNLRQPHAPRHDLWRAIDAALDGQTISAPSSNMFAMNRRSLRVRRRRFAAAAAGACLLLGAAGWYALPFSAPFNSGSSTLTVQWQPSDPRWSGAAIELHAAHRELQQAMRQAPASAALQRLLERTELQQSQLRQLARQAG
jgi:tryptophan 2,3-dioxygenase